MKSLSKFVVAYNNCFPDGLLEAKTSKIKSSWYLVAGIHSTRMTMGNTYYGAKNEGEHGPDITPFGGFAYEAVLPRNRETWSIYNELIYRYYSLDGVFEATQLKASFVLRYKLMAAKVRPFVGIGPTYGFALTSKSPLVVAEPGKPYIEVYRRHEAGLTAVAGLYVGRFVASVRYEKTDGFSVNSHGQTIFDLWYGSVGFRLR